MNDKILENYQAFRQDTIRDIVRLQDYSHADLNRNYKVGKWSANQILLHLLGVEKVVLSYIRKKAQAENLAKAGLKSWFRSKTLKLFMRLPLRFKAPPTLPEPPEGAHIQDIAEELNLVRNEMEDFICKLPPKNRRDLIFRHPRAGMLSMRQTIDFLSEHWDHHRKQLELLESKILKDKIQEEIRRA